MKRIICRGTISLDGARYTAAGLACFHGIEAEITAFPDGTALAQIGADLFPLERID